MNKILILLSLLMLPILMAGCGGGGGSASGDGANLTVGSNQALLGPLAGAEIRAFRLNDLSALVEGPIVSNSNSTDLSLAGTFDLTLASIPDDEYILVTATGGMDIDADDDGILDISPTLNEGSIQAIATAASWRSGVNISAISDVIARQIAMEMDISSATHEAVAQALADHSSDWVDDVNEDRSFDYHDVLEFNPSDHKEKSIIPWDMILQHYISALHRNANTMELLSRARLLLTNLEQEYDSDTAEGRTWINGDDNLNLHRLTVLDADSDGVVDRAVIQQLESGANIKTVIAGNIENSETVIVDVNYGGNNFQFSFVSETNFLGGGSSENELLALAGQTLLMARPSTDYPGLLELEIPKTLMSSLAATSLTMSDSATDKLFVVEDDPVIGWYFNESDGTAEIEYELPGIVEGGVIIITQEAILFNEGEVVFNWRERSCNSDEAFLGSADSLEGSLFHLPDSASGLYKLCVAHLTADLTSDINASGTGPFTTVLNYDPDTGRVFPPNVSNSRTQPIKIAAYDPDLGFKILTAENNPAGDHSCGFSIGNDFYSGNGNFIGDCGYNVSGRVWTIASNNGEIARYDFEGNGNDLSGNSNHLQEYNVSYSSVATGLSADFNGQNSSLERVSFDGMSLGHTTSFKVYFNDVQTMQAIFQNLVSNVDRNTCSVFQETLSCGFYDGTWKSKSGPVETGKWYDVTASWDGSDFQLLIDGILQSGPQDPTANIINPKFVIGVRNDGLWPFNGSIDEFSISLY